jgi:hypothetical protein
MININRKKKERGIWKIWKREPAGEKGDRRRGKRKR